MKIIDAHNHVTGTHPEFLRMMAELELKILNICVAGEDHDWRAQREYHRRNYREHPDRFAWCTAFDIPHGKPEDYVARVISELEHDIADGAVACKVWKNYGMTTRSPRGHYVMVDDPVLEPIFAHLAAIGLPVIMHLADPMEAWLPLDPAMLHYNYYHQHPQYHVYGRDDIPGHDAIMAARDRVLARHPGLRVIGAHMLSLEHDVREVAGRFEQFPNVAVDTSARLADIAWQDRDTVRDFCLRWHDRIIFGADWGSGGPLDQLPDERRRGYTTGLRAHYEQAMRFFTTGDTMSIHDREVRGLALPADVCHEIFVLNAQRWLPGI